MSFSAQLRAAASALEGMWVSSSAKSEARNFLRDAADAIEDAERLIAQLRADREELIRQARIACHQAKTDAEKRRAHEAIGQIAQVPLLQPAKKIVPFKPPTLAPKSRK